MFWSPAYPEDDLHAAERALEARRGFGAALAGACATGGKCRHVSSRHTCERWASLAQAHPQTPAAYRNAQAIPGPLASHDLMVAAAAASSLTVAL